MCVARGLASLVVHGHVVWQGASFHWSFMDGHVCGKGPGFLGHSWGCVWQGASFPWSFMDGHVCGKGPRSLGRSWACCVARCLVSLVVHGHVCGKMPCSHRYPDCVACHDLALPASHAFFPWSFMDGHVCGKVPCFLGRSWASVWQGA